MTATFDTLRAHLVAARRAAIPFDDAWAGGVEAARMPTDWRVPLQATREAWKAAYERTPAPPAVRAVASIEHMA